MMVAVHQALPEPLLDGLQRPGQKEKWSHIQIVRKVPSTTERRISLNENGRHGQRRQENTA